MKKILLTGLVALTLGCNKDTNQDMKTEKTNANKTQKANHPPIYESTIDQIILQKNNDQTIKISQNFYDPDGDALKIEAFGTKNLNVKYDGVLTIQPKQNWTGSDTITVKATDTNGASTQKIIPVTVKDTSRTRGEGTKINKAPIYHGSISDIIMNQNTQTGTIAKLSDLFSDQDNDKLRFEAISARHVHPIYNVRTTEFYIKPELNWEGTETITLKAYDPTGLFAQKDIQVTVTPTFKVAATTGLPDVDITITNKILDDLSNNLRGGNLEYYKPELKKLANDGTILMPLNYNCFRFGGGREASFFVLGQGWLDWYPNSNQQFNYQGGLSIEEAVQITKNAGGNNFVITGNVWYEGNPTFGVKTHIYVTEDMIKATQKEMTKLGMTGNIYVEMGNEEYDNFDFRNPQEYINIIKSWGPQYKTLGNNIKIGVVLRGQWQSEYVAKKWNIPILQQCKDIIDFGIVHPYPTIYLNNTLEIDQTTAEKTFAWIHESKEIEDTEKYYLNIYAPGRDIEIIATEFNLQVLKDSAPNALKPQLNISNASREQTNTLLFGVLDIDLYFDMLYEHVDGTMIWNLGGTPWRTIDPTNNRKHTQYYAEEMMGKAGDKLLETRVSSPTYDINQSLEHWGDDYFQGGLQKIPYVSCYATKGKSGIQVYITNKDNQEHTADLNLQGFTPISANITQLKGTSWAQKGITPFKTQLTGVRNQMKLTVPARSATLIEFK